MVITFFNVLWQILKSTYQIWLLILVVVLLEILIERILGWIEDWKDKKWFEKHKKLIEWKKLDGKQFERITAIIFENLGFKVKVIGGAGDRGIDIIAYKDGKKFYIQCKQKEQVSPKEIREFAGAIRDLDKNKGEKGFFVTTGDFTEEGRLFARDNPIEIELINGLELEKLANKINDLT